jgi:hypothetical protein
MGVIPVSIVTKNGRSGTGAVEVPVDWYGEVRGSCTILVSRPVLKCRALVGAGSNIRLVRVM